MLPNLQPTLSGNLLTLRPLQVEDFEALYQAASDPMIWEQHPERNRYEREVFAKYLNSGLQSKGAFVAIDNTTGEIIGSSRYYDFDEQAKEIAIGYTFLVRRCWANGYNKEMKRLMIDHAFTFTDAILFHIGEHNYRSQIATKKTGATLYKTSQGQVELRLIKEQWANTNHP